MTESVPPPPVADTKSPPSPEEKSVIPLPQPDNKIHDSKPLVFLEKTYEAVEVKPSEGSANRDVVLAEVEKEKTLALIKAWEQSQKSKAENKAHRKLSAVSAWENTKKAAVEAELRKFHEKLEKKKAEHAEKIKNKIAEINREAEEKRAIIEAKKGENLLKVKEQGAKFRATGTIPKKRLVFFYFKQKR